LPREFWRQKKIKIKPTKVGFIFLMVCYSEDSMEKSPIVQTIKKVLPAVVSIIVSKYLEILESPFPPFSPFFEFREFFGVPRKRKIQIGGGSGFIVSPSGIILTNRHVVADPRAEYLVVLSDDRKFKAEILARDPINDVAIIKIKAKNLPVVELGDSDRLDLGQTAIAIGNVLGTFRNTVSVGVVSGLSREIAAVSVMERKITRLRGLIQTDAAINPGNSGGPLVDLEGRAIGINAAMVFGAENVGFALPINVAKKDLQDLKKYGRIRQPFLGVRYVLLNKELKERYHLPSEQGALVISEAIPGGVAVVPGSPAAKAGIKELDIILEIQKEKITEKNPLEAILQKFKVGQKINLKILREGKEFELLVTLGEKK